MMDALVAHVATIAADPTLRVVVLQGAGKHFMAGGDLKTFATRLDAEPAQRQADFQLIVDRLHAAIEHVQRMPQVVICALRGAVAGFGLSLAAACDLAVAADDAYFASAYRQIGLTPDGGGTWALPRIVGLRKALEIYLLSERFDAREAQRIGLVNRVVDGAALEATVQRHGTVDRDRPGTRARQRQATVARIVWTYAIGAASRRGRELRPLRRDRRLRRGHPRVPRQKAAAVSLTASTATARSVVVVRHHPVLLARRRDIAVDLGLRCDIAVGFRPRRDVAVAVTLCTPWRALAAAWSLESLLSRRALILAATVRTALPSAVRLAEFRVLRARSAAVSGRAFVAIAARRTARNRERRAAERRRVRVALRLHFVEVVLRPLAAAVDAGVLPGPGPAGCASSRGGRSLFLCLRTRAATARRSLTGRMLALAAGNAALRRVARSMMWLRSAFRVGARGGSGVTLPLRPALAMRAPGAALVRRS